MAFPVSSDILINVLRESCASIEQGYSKKQEQRIYQQQNTQPGVLNIEIGTNKSIESLRAGERICIPRKVYKKNEVDGLINVKRNFPLISNFSNQESPPIDWNLHQESKFGEPLKEESESESENEDNSIMSVDNRTNRDLLKKSNTNVVVNSSGIEKLPVKQSQKEVGGSVISDISDMGQSMPTKPLKKLLIKNENMNKNKNGSSEIQSLPDNNSIDVKKRGGILGRIMRREEAAKEHITTSGAIIDDSTSSDSSISNSSMINGSESVLQGVETTGGQSTENNDVLQMDNEVVKSAVDSDKSVGSIESSEIADDDDQDYLLEPSYLASSYAEGAADEPSGSYSDDYYLDSDYDLDDSDLVYDSSGETSSLYPNSSLYRGDHPVSRINFTRSRPGTYTPFKVSRRGASVRSRSNALSVSQRSRFSSNVRPANLSVIPTRLSLAPASLQGHKMLGTKNSRSLTNMLSLYFGEEDKKSSHPDLDFTKRPVKRRYKLKSRKSGEKPGFLPVDGIKAQDDNAKSNAFSTAQKLNKSPKSGDKLSFSPKMTPNKSISDSYSPLTAEKTAKEHLLTEEKIKSDESLLAGDELSETESLSMPNSESESISLPSSPAEVDTKSTDLSVDSVDEPKSNLTALIKRKTLSLDYYEYVGGKKLPNDKISTVYVIIKDLGFVKGSPLKVKIDTSATVVEMIGYVLLQVWKLHKPEHKKYPQKPNYWAMYLADDDGEAEDDFGVLSRTRKVKSYGTDEFFMTQVSEKEMKRNEVITPSPLEVAEKKSNKRHPSLGAPNLMVDHTKNASPITIPANITPASHAISHFLSPHTGQHDESSLITNEGSVSDFHREQNKPNGGRGHKPPSISQQYQSLFNSNVFVPSKGGDVRLSMYHRWTVWRRQQMSFKGRHPKSLVVDGYQIYILPFNESKGSWYDAKTTSFNIGQIMRIKQSSKIPRYFKIFINKNQNGVYKKYYLEAKSTTECKEITSTIKDLIDTYKREFYY